MPESMAEFLLNKAPLAPWRSRLRGICSDSRSNRNANSGIHCCDRSSRQQVVEDRIEILSF